MIPLETTTVKVFFNVGDVNAGAPGAGWKHLYFANSVDGLTTLQNKMQPVMEAYMVQVTERVDWL